MTSLRRVVCLLMLAGVIAAPGGSVFGQSEIVRTIQQKLLDAGFDPGAADGFMGPRTRQALRQFQAAHNLTASGYVDEPTQRELGVEVPDVVVPAGTRIAVRLGSQLDSGTARAGDEFMMTVAQTVSIGPEGGIPRGAVISGVVREAESAERPQQGGRLELGATAIRSGSFESPLRGHVTAQGESLEGEGSLKEDLKKIGIGAGAGAAIGAILGGKRGALAGVLIGGGGVFLGTKGEQVRLERETPLLVELTSDLTVPAVQ